MKSHDIVAYTMGYLLISNATSAKKDVVQDIPSEERARLKTFVGEAITLANEIVSISVRWLALNIDNTSGREMIQELGRSWMMRAPTFPEYTYFLKGAFEVRNAAKLNRDEIMLAMTELDRVDDGVPLRYQQLYFELAPYISNEAVDTIDFEPLRMSLRHGSVNFPKLELPTLPDVAGGDAEVKKSEASEAKEEKDAAEGSKEVEAAGAANKMEEGTAEETSAAEATPKPPEPAGDSTKKRPARSKKNAASEGIDL